MADSPRKTIPGLVAARNLAAIVGAWFVAAWLHERKDEHERVRLRVAAERCAEPHVRVALQELAAADSGGKNEPGRGARAARAQRLSHG
jgi:hypothetical protein